MAHARLMRSFKLVLARLGCDLFEVYEQVGDNWTTAGDGNGRFVQMMRFRDRKHQMAVQSAERVDTQAQELIREFCELVNFSYQQQQGLFAPGYYSSVLAAGSGRMQRMTPDAGQAEVDETAQEPAATKEDAPEQSPEPQGLAAEGLEEPGTPEEDGAATK